MRFTILLGLFILSSLYTTGQVRIPTVVRQAANTLKQGAPNNAEIILGLKETLDAGITAGTNRLSVEDAFFRDETIRIQFPPEAKKVEKSLRAAGMGRECDQFLKTLNSSAEQAIPHGRQIFVDALRAMTVKDASEILFSKSTDAATLYFEKITTPALMQKFSPVIDSTLAVNRVSTLWKGLIEKYNMLPLAANISSDLTEYVTKKTIQGLFSEIAKEELMIRRNTSMRSTPMMRRIFKQADENLYNVN